jgi:O-acetylhomoserine (thiol)-lyase
MRQHVKNTRAVAEFLEARPDVGQVRYPGLESSPYYELARKYLPEGPGAVFCFELPGGREHGLHFIESLTLFSHLANVGDAKSLVIHPASTTHQQMDAAALEAAGIGEDLVRLSVGLEDPDDLIEDLGRGLHASQKRLAAE